MAKMKKRGDRLAQLRKKIDRSDRLLLKALSERFEAVTEVGRHKRKLNMPIVQKSRWAEVIDDRVKLAKKLNVSAQFTKSVFNLIHREAVRIQRQKK